MVAGLDQDEQFAGVVVGERVLPAVHAPEREIGNLGADREAHLRASSICRRVGSGETRPSGEW